MEVAKEDKFGKWKRVLKKLYNTEVADHKRLDTIQNQLEKKNSLATPEINYLEDKYRQLKSEKGQSPKETTHNSRPDYSEELQIIEQLQKNEIGDYSRLESIKKYLKKGMLLLHEDKQYLKENLRKFEKITGEKRQYHANHRTKMRTSPLKPQTILIDDVEQNPTHDFDSLSKTISKIILDSTPHFTIGIYGEWGTGKTTLMKLIEKNLPNDLEQSQSVLPIWFNAWKYEREENLATMSLMKTVAYAMENHKVFDPLARTIFKGLTIVGKDMMQQIVRQSISQSEISDQEIEQKINYMNQLYRDSVYYEGLDRIREQMEAIRERGDYRVVIFIDDLDRCSPTKALEVLESIKLFLDIEGFVFVIGLSHKTVTHLISQAYERTGIKGEDYVKKIIQIPIKIPSWSRQSIIDLIHTTITPRLNSDYTKFLNQNSGMIAKVVEYNPRQLKRFINNVIIAFETFAGREGSPEVQFNEIFLVKILKSEWPDFYREFVTNRDFQETVKWMITRPKQLRKYFKYIETLSEELPAERRNKRIMLLNKLRELTRGRIGPAQIDLLADFDDEAWRFFENVKDVFYGIEDWKVVNSVMDVVEEFSFDFPVRSKKPKVSAQNLEQKPTE